MKLHNYLYRFLFVLFLLSCGDDNDPDLNNDVVIQTDDDDSSITDNDPILVEGLEIFDAGRVSDGLILVNDASANRVYLLDKLATVVYEWNLNDKKLGNDVFLLPNGQLLANLESESPDITLGGFGGVLALIEPDGEISWSYEYSSPNYIAHHDAVMMPNGNILFLTWQKKSVEEGNEVGFTPNTEVIYDAVFEIDPTTNEIVWQWHMWDHLIQNVDDTKLNFGSVADNPQLIDINYLEVPNDEGDVSHANGLAYDAENDLVYISANFYSEIWVIDHSTTTEEAQTSSGGSFGKGGDLVYRFGNPQAYDNNMGQRRFDRNHHPNLLSGEKKGNILVFANGFSEEQSTAYELIIPENLTLTPMADNEPQEAWSFTDSNLYSGRVSGVVLLPNGNRLITEGDFGFWEVTEEGELVWRYSEPGFFWRGYHYDRDSEAVMNLGLQF